MSALADATMVVFTLARQHFILEFSLWYVTLALQQCKCLAKTTIEDFIKRGVRVIWWPAYSPDLNPIETVWDKMKDWIQGNYGEKLNYNQLRAAVNAVWDHAGLLRRSYSSQYGLLVVINM